VDFFFVNQLIFFLEKLFEKLGPAEFWICTKTSQATVIMQLILVIVMAIVTIPILLFLSRQYHQRRYFSVSAAIVLVLFYGFVLTLPIWFESAHIIDGDIPPKPKLIAHRGLAGGVPENTLAGFNKSAQIGAWGIESGISVTLDGVLFMMHDSTLRRTTNIEQVFPNRADENAMNFTWNELAELSAGSYYSNSFLQEKIPRLDQVLEVVRDSNLMFQFDRHVPPAGHPYENTVKNLTINVLKQYASNFTSRVIWEIYVFAETPEDVLAEKELLESELPGIILSIPCAYNMSASNQQVIDGNFTFVNAFFGVSNTLLKGFASLKKQGVALNTYTLNTEWAFTQMWLLGTNSIATNRISDWLTLTKPPSWYLHANVYLILWIVVDVASFLAVTIQTIMFCIRERRRNREVEMDEFQ